MRCEKCNIEFEGLFCPECGTKYEAIEEVEDDAKETIEEKENIPVAQEESVHEELGKQAVKNDVSTKQQEDLDRRTIRGRIYTTIEEAEIAREENNRIDRLKAQLLSTKSQKKRQKIMSEFQGSFTNSEAKERYGLLQDKVSVNEPKGVLVCRIIGISVLISVAMIMVLGVLGMVENPVFTFFTMWYVIFFFVWLIWKIILIVKRFSPYHYLNIKKI